MLTEAQLQQFHRDGYLKGGKVLSDDDVTRLQDEVLRVIDDKDNAAVPQPANICNMGQENAAVWQIVNIWMASDPFRRLIRHPVINEEMAQLTGATSLRIWHDQIQYKPAAGGGVNRWHQDAPLWPILAPMTEVSAWVALDDVDEENGAMRMVPGSHLWGNNMGLLAGLPDLEAMPSEFKEHPIEVHTRPVKRGEVHFHHALTWHGSPANKSDRPRRAIALHFMTEHTRYVAAGNHLMKRYVTVGDGEMMQGDSFPLVWPQK